MLTTQVDSRNTDGSVVLRKVIFEAKDLTGSLSLMGGRLYGATNSELASSVAATTAAQTRAAEAKSFEGATSSQRCARRSAMACGDIP